MCIDDVSTFYGPDPSLIYKEEFMKALYAQDLEGARYQKIKGYFDENSTGYSKSDIPMLILQGGIDPIVKPSTQKEFMQTACESGNTITYHEFSGVHHFQTRQASFRETLQWMKDLRDDKQIRNDCTA
jgi:S-formylglutathione hydrolase FrmB